MGDDESRLSRQIESVERSVVFLRQEHLTLLHGLHLEILSLQKRCTGEGHTAAVVCMFLGGKKVLYDPQISIKEGTFRLIMTDLYHYAYVQ